MFKALMDFLRVCVCPALTHVESSNAILTEAVVARGPGVIDDGRVSGRLPL